MDQTTKNQIVDGFKNFQIKALQHYSTNWPKYEQYSAHGFVGSSILMGAYSVWNWVYHGKIRAHYTPAQYHQIVRNSSRIGTLMMTSLIAFNGALHLTPYCNRRLRSLTSGK